MAIINGQEQKIIKDDNGKQYQLVQVNESTFQRNIDLLQSYIDARKNNILIVQQEIVDLEMQKAEALALRDEAHVLASSLEVTPI